MSLFGVDIESLVTESLKDQLIPLTLTRTVVGEYDPIEDEQTTTQETYTSEGIVDTYEDRVVAEGLVQSSDRRILILAGPLGTKPSNGTTDNPPDKITIQGETFTVIDVHRDPASATYTVQGRL